MSTADSGATGGDLALSAPRPGTVRRVARPRGEIPEEQRARLEAARDEYRRLEVAFGAAEDRLRAACDAAYVAGGSHAIIAEVSGLAKSTVQKYVTSRRQ